MGITSLQVCMDSSDWLHQGTISEEYIGGGIMDSSPISTPSGGGGGDDENNINSILACGGRSPTLLAAERSRLRPQHEQSPKCPRCESTHTKFCYYNNYSLSQPRYFCKTCRRYWTKGGTLRNIPVGGGCRKNKKVSSSSSASAANKKSDHHPPPPPSSALVPLNRNNHNHNNNPSADDDENHVHLGFSDQLHFSSLHASGFFNNAGNNNNFVLDNNNNNIINNHHTPIDFMDNKYDDFGGMMITGAGGANNAEDHNAVTSAVNFHGFPFGLSSSFLDHHHGSSNSAPINILESCQRLMLPYDNPNQNQNHNHDYNNHNHNHNNNHEVIDVKPNSKILSLEWNDYHNHHHHQQSTGYNFGGLGSWTGLMNGYGSNPATNPLV
ncbi:hypothetical protein ABFX02_09G022000 [Erythranthe guttata]